MKNEEMTGKGQEKKIWGSITYNDGHKEDLTSETIRELLKFAKNMENAQTANPNEKERLEILSTILNFILDFDIGLPGSFRSKDENKEGREYLEEALQNINAYLEQIAQGENTQAEDQISAFLRGQSNFIPVARPRLMEDFLKINDKSDNGAEITRKFKNSTITFTGRLGLDEQKIAEMIRMSFTSANPYKARNNLKTLVGLSLTDVMETLGRTINPNNKKMFVRQLTREILPTIGHAHITLEFMTEKGVEVMHMEIGGGYFEVSSRKDRILFRISSEYAQYLNTNSLSQYYKETLKLGDTKNPLPYYLAVKLQDHYFKDANRARGTNMILSIKSVLEFCADTLEYEYILESDPTHWKRKIKDRLERALNDIEEQGIFKWEYCTKGLGEITQDEVESADFYQWNELYITFQLIPEEPDQDERLQHKRERIEAAKEKKRIEDDRATVEADKIRKRRRRRTTQKQKKGNVEALKG